MAYDPLDNYTVMFGGGGSPSGTRTNETWVFSAGNWSRLSTPVSPPATGSAPLTYDAADGYLLLYESVNSLRGHYFGQTWSFVHGIWKNLTANVTTQPRVTGLASMAFDAADHYVVLYGLDYVNYNYSQTWAFSGGQWTNLSSSPSPPAEGQTNLAWDPTLSGLVLLAVRVEANRLFVNQASCNNTWRFRAGEWTLLPVLGPCLPIGGGALAFDSADSVLVEFGQGEGGACDASSCNATWLFNGTAWAFTDPIPHPLLALGSSPAMAYDAGDRELVLYGGVYPPGPAGGWVFSSSTWVYSNGLWKNVTAAPGPATGGPSVPTILLATAAGAGVLALVVVAIWRSRRRRRSDPAIGQPPVQ